jgi:hypothetical protein
MQAVHMLHHRLKKFPCQIDNVVVVVGSLLARIVLVLVVDALAPVFLLTVHCKRIMQGAPSEL